MKKILFASLFLLPLISCDNRNEYFDNLNKTPEIKIRKSGTQSSFETILSDSIKLKNPNYTIEYSIKDEEKLSASVSYILGGGSSSLNALLNQVLLIPAYTNVNKISFVVKDGFDKISEANLNLTVFENLEPVALAVVTNTKINSPYEVNISAKTSYDKDAKYGGKIISYEFKIGSTYINETSLNNINYIFNQPGNYQISLRVKDDNNVWSAPFTTYVQLN